MRNTRPRWKSVDIAEAEILKAAASAGFGDDDQHRIGMAVRECMVNAVVHGNRYNRNKQSSIERLSRHRLTIHITDQGEGFEMHEVPDPLHDTNLLRHSGRGLFMMGAFMDDMKVRVPRRAPKSLWSRISDPGILSSEFVRENLRRQCR